MNGYELLAIKIIACAVEDYKKVTKSFMRASPAKKRDIIKEKKDIEAFLLSEKFNYTDITGERLLELAKDKSIPATDLFA